MKKSGLTHRLNVLTTIGKKFFSLPGKHVPKAHKLHKLFNSNNVEVSFSSLPNSKKFFSLLGKHIPKAHKRFRVNPHSKKFRVNPHSKKFFSLLGKHIPKAHKRFRVNPHSKKFRVNPHSKKFFSLMGKHIPKAHKLHKSFNSNNVKVSFSFLPNIESLINGHSENILYE